MQNFLGKITFVLFDCAPSQVKLPLDPLPEIIIPFVHVQSQHGLLCLPAMKNFIEGINF